MKRTITEDLDRLLKKTIIERYTAEEKANIFALLNAVHIAIALTPTKKENERKS